MDRADFSGVLLLPPPVDVRREIATLGANQLAQLDPDQVVCVDATGTALTMQYVVNACRVELNETQA